MQDSIIVYRNPLEKAVWEGNYVLPIMSFAVVMGVVFLLVYKALEKCYGKEKDWFMWVAGVVSCACGIMAFIWMRG